MTRQEKRIVGQAAWIRLRHGTGVEDLGIHGEACPVAEFGGLVHARRETRLDGWVDTPLLDPYLVHERAKDEQATIASDPTTVC